MLLDTHVLLWWLADDARLTQRHRELLDRADASDRIALSNATLWEIAVLHERGRVSLHAGLLPTLQAIEADVRVLMLPLSARVAAAAYTLPDSFHRDPVDRLLVATAQVHRLRLATCDGLIAQSGAVDVI